MQKKFPKSRQWKKLVGLSGDLADVIVIILSLVSLHQGIARLRFSEFQQAFKRLGDEFPKKIPQIIFTDLGVVGCYSKELDDALVDAYSLGVSLFDAHHIGVLNSTVTANLQRISRRLGQAFIDELRPVADRFAEILRQDQ